MSTRNIANELPFDILCVIFEHYAAFDSPITPLETLLLISKPWHNAALGDARLWSSFDVLIYNSDDFHYWTSCVTRRRDRCSPSVLLDISIRLPLSIKRSYNVACETFIMQLVGESGEVARRWRRFVLTDPTFYMTGLGRWLSFPTPNLEEIRLDNRRIYILGTLVFLPDTSCLRIFHIAGLDIPTLPNLAGTKDLNIRVCRSWGDSNEQIVAQAVNVVTMKIYNRTPFKLTITYERLRSLELQGRLYEDCLSAFSAPILTDLTLAVEKGKGFHHVVSCQGINLTTLRKLHIRREHDHLLDQEIAEYLDGVRQLLTAAINLEVLVLEHTPIAHSILQLLKNNYKWLYQSHSLRLVLREGVMELDAELRPGEDRVASVDQLTREIGCKEGCIMVGFEDEVVGVRCSICGFHRCGNARRSVPVKRRA